jgi:hypothetical protein
MALTVAPIVPVSEAWRSLPELYSPKCPEAEFPEGSQEFIGNSSPVASVGALHNTAAVTLRTQTWAITARLPKEKGSTMSTLTAATSPVSQPAHRVIERR